jgi:ABC-2 type transport system permease protein
MWLSVVAKYVRLSWCIFRANLASAVSFPLSFLLHVIGIVIFFGGQFFIWTVFFTQFPSVGGWNVHDVIIVYSLYIWSLSVLDVFCGGVMNDLAKIINAGNLDYFLTLPKPVLWHVAVSRSDVISLGTMVLSIAFFMFSGFCDLAHILLFLFASCFFLVLLFNFFVVTQSIAFFIGGFEQGASAIRHLLSIVSPYPFSIFPSPFKYVLMTFVPSFFVVTLPAQLIKNFSFSTLGILIIACLVSSLLAYIIFKKGLARYESGSLINVRM